MRAAFQVILTPSAWGTVAWFPKDKPEEFQEQIKGKKTLPLLPIFYFLERYDTSLLGNILGCGAVKQ